MSLHISKEHDTELARQAYAAVAEVPTIEPNDRNRLGYHVWLYLRGELGSLEEAVHLARCRFSPRELTPEEVMAMIERGLEKAPLVTYDIAPNVKASA